MEVNASGRNPLPSSTSPPPYLHPQPVVESRGVSRIWKWIAILAVVAFVLSRTGPGKGMMPGGLGHDLVEPADRMLHEVVFRHLDEGTNKVVLIEVQGIITGQAYDGGSMDPVEAIESQFKRAASDPSVMGVILKVDSPGGEVVASDRIARKVRDFQEKTGHPVIALMGAQATSGGYYVSAPARWIIADPLTMTGSIGVIMHGYNYRGLMDKLGVAPMVFKSGAMKDMLSGDRPLDSITQEETALVQEMIDETYERFLEVVEEGRKKDTGEEGSRLAEGWKDLADGRIFSGRKALEAGFIDQHGDLDTAIEKLAEWTGKPVDSVVRFQRMFDFGHLFRFLGQSPENRASLKVDLGQPGWKVPSGRLYFLPHLLTP